MSGPSVYAHAHNEIRCRQSQPCAVVICCRQKCHRIDIINVSLAEFAYLLTAISIAGRDDLHSNRTLRINVHISLGECDHHSGTGEGF